MPSILLGMDLHTLSRRRLLKASAATLLASAAWPGQLWADQTATKNFKFIQVNDLHYTDEKCGPYFEALVKQFNDTKDVDFVLFAGDLSEDGHANQLNPFHDIIKQLKMPYHVTIGNHDHEKTDGVKVFDDAFAKSRNFMFDHNGYQVLSLDTHELTKFNDVTCSTDTLNWLDTYLPKIKKDVPIILMTHFPLGPTTPMRLKNADDVLDRLKDLNLQAIFNGHFHGYTERTVQHASATTNACCSYRRNNHDNTKRKGYFLCNATDGQIAREFVEFKRMDYTASTQPSTTQPADYSDKK